MHAERDSIAVVDASAFGEPSTKQAAKPLEAWKARRPTLVVLGADEGAAAKSFRNIDGVKVALASAVGVADVIGASSLVISEAALKELEGRAA